jgi:hypothetical protein
MHANNGARQLGDASGAKGVGGHQGGAEPAHGDKAGRWGLAVASSTAAGKRGG